jgi:acetyl-CoA acetyltransferase
MSEVVITAIGRTPIGRAAKGSLIDQRLETMCVGGGQGMAMVVERLS